jgi:hypothetical protein
MDYEYIQDENHNDYIDRIIGLIQSNSQTNSMNLFIHKIIKQPEEYQILCNALYWFIKETPIQQGGSDSPEVPAESPVAAVSEEATGAPPAVIAESGTSAEVAPTTKDYQDKIIKNLEQLKSKTFITIPYKNKLLIDQGFKQSNYKHYLSFYIINQQYI